MLIRPYLRNEVVTPLPAIPEFVLEEAFNCNNTEVSIIEVDSIYELWPADKKVVGTEQDIEARWFRVDTIRRHKSGPDLVSDLQLDQDLVKFGHIYHLLKQQPHGEPGFLLTNRRPTQFVTSIVNGVARAVRLRYYDREKARAAKDIDTTAYNRSGWIIRPRSVTSIHFGLQGERIGFYC